MPQERPDGSFQFSLKLPPDLLTEVEEFAENRKWSRSQAVAHLMDVGISGEDHGVSVHEDETLTEEPFTTYTKNEDMVRNVEGLADEEYDGSFNAAARWAIRNGLEEAGTL
jgi:hypothetical protein